jgi:uncharacterized membrane protein YfcA
MCERMMSGLPLELLLGFVIGLSLGLLGGGGSILTVPALVYLVGQSPQAAVTTSLAIVGGNSLIGVAFHRGESRRTGSSTLNWKVAILFGAAGMLTAYASAGLSQHFTPEGLLVAFAVLMLVVAGLMLFRRERPAGAGQPRPWWIAPLAGAGVGVLTGILGVGGGFLIVPALVMLVGLPMFQAVGTSLIIIAANSLAGLLGHLDQGWFDLGLTAVFVTAGFGGTFIGSRLAHRLPAARLRQAFALFVVVLAVFLLADNLPKL